jgi:hypothetical protein
MRYFTCYLAVSEKSGWEVDWREFRKQRYSAHTVPQTIMFLVLVAMGVVFPFGLSGVFQLKITSSVLVPATAAVFLGLIVAGLICLMAFANLWNAEERIVERWQKLRSGPS